MNKIWWVLVAVIIVGLGWWALGNKGGSTVSETGPIKIGVIGPFTGDAAVYGEPMRNTIQLAVDEINANGGIGERQVEVIFEDGKCDGTAGASAAQKLVNVDKVQSIIGGFCSGETIPSVPIAAEGKVVLLSPSASSPALTDISAYFFRDYPSDAKEGQVLAAVANQKGYKTMAFIQEQTDYAAGLYGSFDKSFTALGGKTTNEQFPTSNTDFRSTLTKIKAQKPDALFIDTQTPAAADRILKQMSELGWKPQIFVSDVTMGDPDTLSKDKALLEGAIGAEFVPNATDPKLAKLLQDYKTKFNKDMPYVGYMACTYDAVYVLKDGIATVGNSGEKLAAWSRTIQNWAGASGLITIGSNGDRVSGHQAEVVKNGKTELLK